MMAFTPLANKSIQGFLKGIGGAIKTRSFSGFSFGSNANNQFVDFTSAQKSIDAYNAEWQRLNVTYGSSITDSQKMENSTKAIAKSTTNATGTLKLYADQCKATQSAMTSGGYVSFLRDGGYTKGLSGIKQVAQAYNAIPAAVRANTAATVPALEVSKRIGAAQAEFASQVGLTNGLLGQQVGKLDGATASTGKLIAMMIKQKAIQLGLNALTMAGNMAMAMVISMLVSKGISAISNWIHREEILIEKGKEAENVIKKNTESINELAKTTNDAAGKYAVLSQGVDAFGNNLSLTTAQYQEFCDLSNTLAQTFPALVTGYTSNGDALLGLAGNVSQVTDALKEMQAEAQRELREDSLKQIIPHWIGINQQVANIYDRESMQDVKVAQDALTNLQGLRQSDWDTVTLSDITENPQYANRADIVDQLFEVIRHEYDNNPFEALGYAMDDLNNLRMDEFIQVLQRIPTTYDEATRKQVQEIQALYTQLKPDILLWADKELDKQNITGDTATAIKSILAQVNMEDTGITSLRGGEDWAKTQIIDPIAEAAPEAQEKLLDIFKINDTLSSGELQTQVDSLIASLGLDSNSDLAVNLRVMFNLVDETGLSVEDKIQVLTDKFTKRLSGTPTSQTELKTLQDLNTTELTDFFNYVQTGKADGVKSMTEAFDQFNLKASETAGTVADYTEAMEGAKSQVDTLSAAYDKITAGEWTSSDAFDLFNEFPDLSVYADDTDALKNALQGLMNSSLDTVIQDLQNLADSLPAGEEKQKTLQFIAVLNQLRPTSQLNELTQQFESLSDSISKFQSAADLLAQAKSDMEDFGGFSTSTLTSIIEQFPTLEQSVAEYLAGIKTSSSLMQDIQDQYQIDAKNNAAYLQDKLRDNEEFYKACKFLDVDFMNKIADNYGVDLKNCKTYTQAKLAYLEQIREVAARAETAFTAGMSSSMDISEYYDAATGQTTAAYEELLHNVNSQYAAQIITLVQAVMNQQKAYLSEFEIPDFSFDNVVSNFEQAASFETADTDTTTEQVDETDEFAEAAQAELDALEHLHNMKLITEKQYYEGLLRINNKYYATNTTKYLSEYRSMLEKARSAYIDMANQEKEELQYQYDMKLLTAMDYYTKLNALNDKYYKGKPEYQDEYRAGQGEVRQAYIDSFEKEQSSLDHLRKMNVIDDKAYYFELEKLVEKYYKGKLEFVEEYKTAEEEIYESLHDMKIKALQDEIDALNKTKEETQEVLDVQKKYWDYFNAYSQKNVRVYDESKGGWTWEAPQADVKETKQAYADALLEQEIDAMQDLVDALEKNTYNLTYTDPVTGQLVQAEHLDLLSSDQYAKLYDSTFSDGGIKSVVDGLKDLAPAIEHAASIVSNSQNYSPSIYFNVEKVLANDADSFVNSMSEFLNNTNQWSALFGKQ